MTLRSMARLARPCKCAPRHASQNSSLAPSNAPRRAWTSCQPPGEDDDGPPLSRKSCQLRLADHAHQPIDICREAQFAVVRSIEIHCSHQYSSRRASPRQAARCSEMRPSPNSTCVRPEACKRARVACRRAWTVERPPRRQSSPSCSGFAQPPEVALVVSSVVSHSWKFDERSATDTIASGSPASTRPDRKEGELP